MNLNISIREVEGAVIVDLAGRFVYGRECDKFQERARQLIADGKRKLVLNLENVIFCDSSGMGNMVSVYVSLRNRGGELRLVAPRERVQESLDVTKLSTVFDIVESEEEALASFR